MDAQRTRKRWRRPLRLSLLLLLAAAGATMTNQQPEHAEARALSWIDDDRGLFGRDTRVRIDNKTATTTLGWSILSAGNFLSLFGTVYLIFKVSMSPSMRKKPQYILMRSYAIFQNFHYVECGIQCFVSLVSDRFMGSALACIIQAVLHQFAFVSFTLMMVVTIYHTHYQVVHLKSWTTARAVSMSWAVAVFSAIVVLLPLPLPGTRIAMEPVGVFCFYDFRSAANAGFITAVFVGIGAIFVLFGRVYHKVAQHLAEWEATGGTSRASTRLSLSKLRLRIAASVAAFVIGACPIAASILKSQITQEEPGKVELLIVATCVVSYGIVWTAFVLWSDRKLRPACLASVLGYSVGALDSDKFRTSRPVGSDPASPGHSGNPSAAMVRVGASNAGAGRAGGGSPSSARHAGSSSPPAGVVAVRTAGGKGLAMSSGSHVAMDLTPRSAKGGGQQSRS